MQYIISAESGISDYYFCAKFTNTSNSPAIHSHIEFIYVLDGELLVITDKKSHTIHKNETAIIMPYEVHSYKTEKHSEIFIIACPPDYMDKYKQTLTSKMFSPPVAPFGNSADGIINDIISSEMKDDLKKASLIYYTLSQFMQNCKMLERESYEFDTYRRAIAYISSHYRESLTLENVAKYIGVTSSHLSRVLNGGCKSSFTDILNSLRIHHAKRLLENTDIPISEAAYESGYGSLRNFNRIFRKYFGCTPKEIRDK